VWQPLRQTPKPMSGYTYTFCLNRRTRVDSQRTSPALPAWSRKATRSTASRAIGARCHSGLAGQAASNINDLRFNLGIASHHSSRRISSGFWPSVPETRQQPVATASSAVPPIADTTGTTSTPVSAFNSLLSRSQPNPPAQHSTHQPRPLFRSRKTPPRKSSAILCRVAPASSESRLSRSRRHRVPATLDVQNHCTGEHREARS